MFAAVPSIRKPAQISNRSKRAALKQCKREVQELLEKDFRTPNHSNEVAAFEEAEEIILENDSTPEASHEELETNIISLRHQLTERDRQLEIQRQEIEQLKEKNVKLQQLNEDLQKVHDYQALAKAESLLATKYSRNQIDVMLGRKKRVVWTAEELSKGFTMKYLSKPALEYTINTLKFPLPSVSCLESHAANINMRKGFFHEVFQIIGATASSRSEKEKIIVLMYDEVSCVEAYEFDKKNGDILGPHSKMQVNFLKVICVCYVKNIFLIFR